MSYCKSVGRKELKQEEISYGDYSTPALLSFRRPGGPGIEVFCCLCRNELGTGFGTCT